MPQKKIAIIGAGPKAAAIAAKAAVLRMMGLEPPEIDIFEPLELGAAWTGKHGFTDGEQALCTLAERDLGYPYETAFHDDMCGHMYASFSWQAFCVSQQRYGKWVTDGRNPPSHRVFAEYISWAISKCISLGTAQWLQEAVTKINWLATSSKWEVTSGGALREYDGIVITGSGGKLPSLAGSNSRVIDGCDFWRNLQQIKNLILSDDDPAVVIIGAGGTAAAVANWFVRAGISSIPIKIIGREPTLYARRSNAFEDRYFTDTVGWDHLSPHAKDTYLRRLTTGVVWENVLHNLQSDNVEYMSYDVRGFRALPGATPVGMAPLIAAELFETTGPGSPSPATPSILVPASVFVDARGFDRWSFEMLFDPNSVERLAFQPANRPILLQQATFHLAFDLPVRPNLHVPTHASIRGPGAVNLMALGWVADRILSAYVP